MHDLAHLLGTIDYLLIKLGAEIVCFHHGLSLRHSAAKPLRMRSIVSGWPLQHSLLGNLEKRDQERVRMQEDIRLGVQLDGVKVGEQSSVRGRESCNPK